MEKFFEPSKYCGIYRGKKSLENLTRKVEE